MAIVYQHRRKDTNDIFYIGIGKNKNRALAYGRNPHWNRVADKYGYEVDILIDGCTWEEACEIEKGLIKDYGRADLGLGKLVNLTDGGDGILGHKHSYDTINNMSKERLGNKNGMYGKGYLVLGEKNGMFGKSHKDTTIQKMKNKKVNECTKEKMRIKASQRIGNKSTAGKAVLQYDMNGIFIKEHIPSTFAKLETGASNIGAVCKGNLKSSGGFIWKYKKL